MNEASVRGFHASKNSSGSIEMNIFSTINEDVLLQYSAAAALN
jgi:hypothetical protein